MELVVRALTPDDLPLIEPWFDDPATARWLGGREWPQALLRLAHGPYRHALAAVVQGELAAVADVEKYHDARAAVALVVAPDKRGQGLGVALLLALRDHPALVDVEEFFAGVEQGNDASLRLLTKINPVSVSNTPDQDGFTYFAWRR